MKKLVLALLGAGMLAAMSGCVVAPPPPPPAAVAPAPYYASPGVGWVWMFNPTYGWGWHHPQYGWHRGWR